MKKFHASIRKLTVAVLAVVLIAGLAPIALAAATEEISVTIDGVAVQFPDQLPVIEDGRTLVPISGVFGALGFTPEWNEEERLAVLASEEFTVAFTIDLYVFTVNDETFELEVPARIIGDRTMVPLRPVLEAIGIPSENIGWDEENRAITVVTVIVEVTEYEAEVEVEHEEEVEYDAEEEYEEEAEYDAEEEYEEEAEYDAEEEYEAEAEYDAEEEYEAETEYDAEDEEEVESIESFQSILDRFTEKLVAATPGLLEEFEAYAAELTDMLEIIELAIEFTLPLTELSIMGIAEMATLQLAGVGTYEDFERYVEKLTEVYTEEASRITELSLELIQNI